MRKPSKEERRESYQLHVSPEHLEAIGQVAIRAAFLDELIELTSAQIIRRYTGVVQKHLDELTIPPKLNLIKDDLIQALPMFRHSISEFASEIHSARRERNDIIHGIWRPTKNEETKTIVKILKDGSEKVRRRVTAKTMIRLANQLIDLAIELGDWKVCFNFFLAQQSPASPDKHQRPSWMPQPPRLSEKDRQGLPPSFSRQFDSWQKLISSLDNRAP